MKEGLRCCYMMEVVVDRAKKVGWGGIGGVGGKVVFAKTTVKLLKKGL
jgi:hypothetical protein